MAKMSPPTTLMLMTLGAIGVGAIYQLTSTKAPPGRIVAPPRGKLTQLEGKKLLMDIVSKTPADAAWFEFLVARAYRESRWFPTAHNDDPREVAASSRAYERNLERYVGCPWAPSRYKLGSGGYLGIIPPNGLAAFWGTKYECMDPRMVFDPIANVVMGLFYGKRLMGWSNFKKKPTFLNLWSGWGNPSRMGEAERLANVRPFFADALQKSAEDPSLIDEIVPSIPLPSNGAVLYDQLQQLVA